jgi:type II secretory ATPase GspE/PulE/Tfp pilus assembly ATPase PilB-like protein
MGINQVQMHEEIGLNFATALRSFLRQDPDIIMVGEIRDEETGHIACEAAMTGHLVLSTIHTNDATSVIARLAEMGVAPYLIASTLECVLAQRLIRTLCKSCKVPDPNRADRYGRTPLYFIQNADKAALGRLRVERSAAATACRVCSLTNHVLHRSMRRPDIRWSR